MAHFLKVSKQSNPIKKVRKFLTLIILFVTTEICSAQIMYRTRYVGAIMFETFGISPIASVNYEVLPIRWRNSFVSTRVGLGIVPGGKSTTTAFVTNAGGFSLPASLTYNLLFNNLRKGIYRRVYKRCKSAPSRVAAETFGEIGGGYAMTASRTSEIRHYNFGILGLRQQVVFDIPPHPRVLYVRGAVTPAYVENKWELRGGLGLGISL